MIRDVLDVKARLEWELGIVMAQLPEGTKNITRKLEVLKKSPENGTKWNNVAYEALQKAGAQEPCR